MAVFFQENADGAYANELTALWAPDPTKGDRIQEKGPTTRTHLHMDFGAEAAHWGGREWPCAGNISDGNAESDGTQGAGEAPWVPVLWPSQWRGRVLESHHHGYHILPGSCSHLDTHRNSCTKDSAPRVREHFTGQGTPWKDEPGIVSSFISASQHKEPPLNHVAFPLCLPCNPSLGH